MFSGGGFNDDELLLKGLPNGLNRFDLTFSWVISESIFGFSASVLSIFGGGFSVLTVLMIVVGAGGI